MGIADSPLRDRVIFVVGAPRSGTTWLLALIAAHPDVAGSLKETHLFDHGVDRLFDNFELRGRAPQLASFLNREQLVELVRQLCDGVLLRMREQEKPSARFVVEKTPLNVGRMVDGVRPELEIERKLECYPDAWYVHIVRDPDAAGASLSRVAWAPDHPRPGELVRRGTEAVRTVLRDHGRHREIAYEALHGDPAGVACDLFAELGLEHGERVRKRLRGVSTERYASPPKEPARAPQARAATPDRGDGRSLLQGLAQALRARDAAALRELTEESLVVELHSADQDLHADGDQARAALIAWGERLFRDGMADEEWSVATGEPFHSLMFAGTEADGERTVFSLAATAAKHRLERIVVVSPGSAGSHAPKKRLSTDAIKMFASTRRAYERDLDRPELTWRQRRQVHRHRRFQRVLEERARIALDAARGERVLARRLRTAPLTALAVLEHPERWLHWLRHRGPERDPGQSPPRG